MSADVISTKEAARSLKADMETWVRALIALIVIGVTFWLTIGSPGISGEWEAVFLLVIGYYFNDRPAQDREIAEIGRSRNAGEIDSLDSAVVGETLWQFILATVLIVGGIVAFMAPKFRPAIPGAWIGAVVLAVGFYFKTPRSQVVAHLHATLRMLLAGLVVLSVVPLAWASRTSEQGLSIPVQWIGVVVIVVAFYFKEHRQAGRTALVAG